MNIINQLKIKYREPMILLKQLVITDFKLRYKGSALGYLWSLLRPLFLFLVLYVVFAVILNVGEGVDNFPIYLLLGIVLWTFFVEMTQQSLTSIVARADLIRKIRIPRWLIIVSSSFSALISLLLNLIVVIIFAIIYGMDFSLSAIFLPLYVIEIYIFAVGLSFILASLFVKYRDIGYIWEVVVQAGFYATPILYPLSKISSDLIQKIMILNPMAQSIQGARNVFVSSGSLTISDIWSNGLMIFVPLIIVISIFISGALYFRKSSVHFAENL